MPSPLCDYTIAGREVRIVATDRNDGDIHPERVPGEELAAPATRRRRVAVGR